MTSPPNSAQADFAQLEHYRAANQALKQSGAPVRVVFLGDSITEYWGMKAGMWFRHDGWINRGVGGQTTAQLLLREQEDALGLHPEAIVLEGGANDMRLGFAPWQIRDRILTMGEQAELHGVKVFVATMTPVCDCFTAISGLRSKDRIAQLNALLLTLCAARRWTLIDAAGALKDDAGLMRKELTVEGVHPNDEGYARMAPTYEAALAAYR